MALLDPGAIVSLSVSHEYSTFGIRFDSIRFFRIRIVVHFDSTRFFRIRIVFSFDSIRLLFDLNTVESNGVPIRLKSNRMHSIFESNTIETHIRFDATVEKHY